MIARSILTISASNYAIQGTNCPRANRGRGHLDDIPLARHIPTLGLNLRPEASEGILSTDLPGSTETIEFEGGDFKGADLGDPNREAGMVCRGHQNMGKTTEGDPGESLA